MLESGNASGAFLQIPTSTLDKIPGPMDAGFLFSVGLGFGTRFGRTQLFPTPVLDKNRFPRFSILLLTFFGKKKGRKRPLGSRDRPGKIGVLCAKGRRSRSASRIGCLPGEPPGVLKRLAQRNVYSEPTRSAPI